MSLLEEMTAEDLYNDYILFLQHCDEHERNIETYFREFEEQEGENISEFKKAKVRQMLRGRKQK